MNKCHRNISKHIEFLQVRRCTVAPWHACLFCKSRDNKDCFHTRGCGLMVRNKDGKDGKCKISCCKRQNFTNLDYFLHSHLLHCKFSATYVLEKSLCGSISGFDRSNRACIFELSRLLHTTNPKHRCDAISCVIFHCLFLENRIVHMHFPVCLLTHKWFQSMDFQDVFHAC